MHAQPNQADLYKRHASKRHRGVSYRERADGSRTYAVYAEGKYVPAGATEREALAKQAELRGRKARGERIIVPSKVALEVVAEEWYEDATRRLRAGTLKDYRSYLDRIILPKLGKRPVSSIGADDVVEVTRELEGKGLSQSSVANTLKPLAGTLAHAVFKGYIAVNPMTQVPRGYRASCNSTREHREWTTAEVLRLIRAGHALDERKKARAEYGLAIEVKVRSGARLGELLGARYCDIDHSQGVWSVRAQWTKDGRVDLPKTKKSIRRVPLAPELLRKIAARKLRMGAGDEDFLFASSKGGGPISHSNFRRRGWDEAVKNAGLADGPKVTPHDARHAFASEMAELGLSSSDVAEVMGHATAGITERIYTHAFNREAREHRVREAMAAAMAGGAS